MLPLQPHKEGEATVQGREPGCPCLSEVSKKGGSVFGDLAKISSP